MSFSSKPISIIDSNCQIKLPHTLSKNCNITISSPQWNNKVMAAIDTSSNIRRKFKRRKTSQRFIWTINKADDIVISTRLLVEWPNDEVRSFHRCEFLRRFGFRSIQIHDRIQRFRIQRWEGEVDPIQRFQAWTVRRRRWLCGEDLSTRPTRGRTDLSSLQSEKKKMIDRSKKRTNRRRRRLIRDQKRIAIEDGEIEERGRKEKNEVIEERESWKDKCNIWI